MPVEPITRVLLNIGVVILFAYMGLYTAVFATLVRRFGLWSAPLVWPLLELARSRLQIAFPWDLLGYSMTPYVPFIQLGSIGGVYLISAWLVLVNLLLYYIIRPAWFPSPAPGTGQSPIVNRQSSTSAILLAAALILPLAFGLARLRPNKPWFNVAILQPNVSPLDKGDWGSREVIQADLVRMTCQAAESKPDLILYPETATLVDVTTSNAIGPAIRRLVDSLGIEVFTGTPLYDKPHQTWHNGAALIRPGEDSVRQRYYKIRLTPFSEKIPYADEVPFIKKLVGTDDMGDWSRGRERTIFHWKKGTLSGLICIEAIFPDHAREFARRGSKLFAVVTNDGWFGRLLGAQQHAELAVLRTVEDGLPMIRSANNGISCIIDPYGRVLKQTPLFVQTVLTGTVPMPLPATPYRLWGDWYQLLFLAALILVPAIRPRKHPPVPARPS